MTLGKTERLHAARMASEVLLRIIVTERVGESQQAMETAQHRDRLPKNQPAEITMFQISEVQESPAFNDRRSFLALRLVRTTLLYMGLVDRQCQVSRLNRRGASSTCRPYPGRTA